MPQIPTSEDLEQIIKKLGQNDINHIREMKQSKKNEERLRLLIENSKDSFIIHDFGGKVIDANKHACDSLGYTRDEFLTLTIADIDADYHPGNHRMIWEKIAPNKPAVFEGVHKRKNGTIFPVEVKLSIFLLHGQQCMLGIVRDISDRKNMDNPFSKENEFLNLINLAIEQANDAIWISKTNGDIKYINKTGALMFGYKPEDLMGKNMKILHTQKQLEKIYIPYINHVKKFTTHKGELKFLKKNGTEFTIWASTTFFKRDSNRGFITIAQDIK